MRVTVKYTEGQWRKIDGKATVVPKNHNFTPRIWAGDVFAKTLTAASIQAAIQIQKETGLKAAFVFDIQQDEQDQLTIWGMNQEYLEYAAKSVRGGKRHE